MEGQDQDSEGDEDTPGAGDDVGHDSGDETLDSEGEDELQTAEAGHQVGGDELQGLGEGREGEQPRH